MSKILLVDDDPDVRYVMSHFLQTEGYDVDTASKKEEVLQKLRQHKPAVILMDVLLSGADGRELCRELKAADTTKDIPVIMVSGHPSAAQQFEMYGASDFIAKPINAEVLLEKISQHINVAE